MLTAGEYFTNVYQGVSKPIFVCGKERQLVCSTMAAAPYLVQDLPEPIWDEAEVCIKTQRASSLSLRWNDRERVVHFTPSQYEGAVYAVLEIAAVTEYPELPELMVALTNARGKLSVYLDTIYFIAQQLGLSTPYGKELGYEVRRILRAAEHVDRLLDMSDRANYRVPMDLNGFVTAFAQGVRDLDVRGSLSTELFEEPVVAQIMPEDMELVLATLISNAFRFGATDVILRTAKVGEKVRITVADNGPGAENPERVFDCGYRTPDKNGSEGLGCSLAMARHVLARQDATLQYERVGSETLFHVEMAAATLKKGMWLSSWRPEDLKNTLSQVRVELSDYMIAMDFEEKKR